MEAAESSTVPDLPTTVCEVRVGNRRGPPGPDHKRGRKVIWGELPTTGVPWLRRWRVDVAAGADVDAVFLYAGQELIHTSSARGAELHAAGQEAAFQGQQELGELAGQLAEHRAEAKALEGQLGVLRQQVAATEEAIARATRELAETRAQLEVERRRVELEVQSLRDHLSAERENARTIAKEAFEQAGRERAQLQEAARLERERVATERNEMAAALRQDRDAMRQDRDALTAERTALRAAHLQDLDKMRAAHQGEIDKLAASHQQQRDQMADQLEKDRQRNQAERDRLQREVEKAAEDAKKMMAASLESMNLAAESVATVGGRVRKLVHDVIEGDQAVVDESIARKVAAAQAIRETADEVKKNLAEQTAPGPSAWDEFIKAGAKVLGRVDPHKVMKLSPRLKKILEDEGDDD